jgi:hypothetical protein
MRVAFISTCDLNIYPAHYCHAEVFADHGAKVTIFFKNQPKYPDQSTTIRPPLDW